MLTDEQLDDFRKYPAVPTSSSNPKVYFLKDGKVVGTGSIGSRYMGHITVFIDRHPESLEYFKDDWAVSILGKDAPFRFHEIMGTPLPALADEPEGRLEGITVVDCFEFDFGFCSKRYSEIEGFGAKSKSDETEPA
jgi:hypothetical protein